MKYLDKRELKELGDQILKQNDAEDVLLWISKFIYPLNHIGDIDVYCFMKHKKGKFPNTYQDIPLDVEVVSGKKIKKIFNKFHMHYLLSLQELKLLLRLKTGLTVSSEFSGLRKEIKRISKSELYKKIEFYWYQEYKSSLDDVEKFKNPSSSFKCSEAYLAYKLCSRNIPIVKAKWIYLMSKNIFQNTENLAIKKILTHWDNINILQSDLVSTLKEEELYDK